MFDAILQSLQVQTMRLMMAVGPSVTSLELPKKQYTNTPLNIEEEEEEEKEEEREKKKTERKN